MEDFTIMTDSSANLTPDLVQEAQIEVIPLTCLTDAGEMPAYDDTKPFDGHSFYDKLRQTGPIKTSMVNCAQFIRAFEPVLKAGQNILYVAMSSGISGTCAAAMQAAGELMRQYPGRVIKVVDTLAASFGEGIFALKASMMRSAKVSLDSAAEWAEMNKRRMCQFFTVDDLMFLHKGGRISSLTARIGSIANIKPLLMGNSEGKIVSCGKVIIVAIAHGDCEKDALFLADQLKKKRPLKDVLIRCYEPGTGSHVGPGAVALFFLSPVAVK